MSVIVDGSNGLIFNDASTQTTAATGFGFKNRIINGDMRIDQRNAGANTTPSNGSYTLDRWRVQASQSSKFAVQQNSGSVTPPSGFKNYLGVLSASAYSVLTNDYFGINQFVEAYNMADFDWGSATAKAVTLSFWVRSSLTGQFGGAIRTGDGSNYSYPFVYTINAANTWEQKAITIPGPTSGTWGTGNAVGLDVWFSLGTGSTYTGTASTWAASNYVNATGSVSVVGTSGATWYVTGVQLEKGSTATSFDYRDYGNELRMCQRYCVVYGDSGQYTHLGIGTAYNATALNITVGVPVPMRTGPALSTVTSGGNWLNAYVGASGTTSNPTPQLGEAGVSCYRIYVPGAGSGWTAGQSFWCQVITSAKLILIAEL